jgi:hypothetical protein
MKNRIFRSNVRRVADAGRRTRGLSLKSPQKLPFLLTGVDRPQRIPSTKEEMMNEKNQRTALSLDWWTVIVGVALATIVLVGLPALPW